MNILVIGSGGREHALVWRLARSEPSPRLFATPGNPGIATLATIVPSGDGSPGAMLAAARAYTASECGSIPSGRSISARETWRKLNGSGFASARASMVVTTSYGTAATRDAETGTGRSARNGRRTAIT